MWVLERLSDLGKRDSQVGGQVGGLKTECVVHCVLHCALVRAWRPKQPEGSLKQAATEVRCTACLVMLLRSKCC